MNDKEKETVVYNLRKTETYINYLFDIDKLSQKDFKSLSLYIGDDLLIENERKEYCDNILKFKKQLLCLYQNAINVLGEYQGNIYDYNQKDNLLNETVEFFKYMNCYSLYEKLNNNKMICYQEKNINENYCYNMGDLSYIMLYKHNTGYRMGIALVHEMGHAIHHSIMKSMKQYYPTPIDEVISICFERIFYNFLLENNMIDSINFEKITHTSFNTYNSFMSYAKSMMEDINNPNYSINLFEDNISIIDNDDGSRLDYDLSYNNYAFANIASAKLFMQYLSDDKYFIKELPNIINDIIHMPMRELINSYGDIPSYTKYLENIKVLKKSL